MRTADRMTAQPTCSLTVDPGPAPAAPAVPASVLRPPALPASLAAPAAQQRPTRPIQTQTRSIVSENIYIAQQDFL